jgi:hypothetical protein
MGLNEGKFPCSQATLHENEWRSDGKTPRVPSLPRHCMEVSTYINGPTALPW